MNEKINNISSPDIEHLSDRDAPPYTRREWYQIGFRDGCEKALEDLRNQVASNKMDD